MECLIKDCKEKVQTRGLCKRHYPLAIRRIKQGITTWDELVALGMAVHKRSLEKGDDLISFETHLANARVNGPEWGKK